MFGKQVMKRVPLIALAVLVLALVTAACAPQPTATPLPAKTPTASPTRTPTPRPTDTPMPTPTPVPSLSGRVTDAATGQGVAGARVEARPAGYCWTTKVEAMLAGYCWQWDYSATAASDGSYAIFDLPAGDYMVRAIAPGYAREYWDNVTPSDKATVVNVSPGMTTTGIDFALTEGGSIAGHIYQSDGTTPIAGAQVLVRPSKYRSDDGFWTVTDAEGAYRVEGLPLGNYKVNAEAPGYARLRYYDGAEGAYDWLQGTDVTVVPPATIPNADIHLHPGASIAGHVYQSDGVTPPACVEVNAAPPPPALEGYETCTNSDGYYILQGLRPGNFTISAGADGFARRWYDSKPDAISAELVSLAEGEVLTGIDFTLGIGAPVRGHIYDEEGEPIPGIQVHASIGLEGAGASRATDSSGAYELWLGTGDYYLDFWSEAPDYVPEWYEDAYRFEDADLVHVDAPNEVSGIDFYLARAGSISGHVYEADGTTPIPSASVYAFPTTGSHPGAGANTGPDGSYTIVGLPSGYYRVQATVSGHESQFYHSAADEASATAVTVNAPNDTPAIDFALSPISE